jgi:hypothetical protein
MFAWRTTERSQCILPARGGSKPNGDHVRLARLLPTETLPPKTEL